MPKKTNTKTAKKKTAGFTAEERAAMKDYAKERRGDPATQGANAVVEKIAAMKEPDRGIGKRLHALITAAAPGLVPRLWYGMPAYSKDDKVLCWYQNATKFKTRYGHLGFSDKANLDEGEMWPIAFALKELTPAVEAKITALVKRAVS